MKKHNLAFIDIETTGLNPEKHEIIEIGCIIAEQKERQGKGPSISILEEFDLKIKPEHIETAEQSALRTNRYSEADWLFASDLKQALLSLAKKIDGCIIVGQNISFDWLFLEKEFYKHDIDPNVYHHKIDVVSLALAKFYDDPGMQKFGLYTLCERFGIKNERAHSALSDIRATLAVYKKLLGA